jgi:hypothetical protein
LCVRTQLGREKKIFTAKNAKGAKKLEYFGTVRVCCCVMLNPSAKLRVNSVKHLLCAFPTSIDEDRKLKIRFFVATLLRMTHESKVFVGCARGASV